MHFQGLGIRAIDFPHNYSRNDVFPVKNRIFLFSLQYLFPESGSGMHFQGSGIRAIDFSHKITPIWVFFGNKKLESQTFFRLKHTCIHAEGGHSENMLK